MADEPRRSGRATKGQHKNASTSPAPTPKPTKGAAAKQNKKAAASQQVKEEEDDEEDVIRCICGNDDENDKRAFVSCDACSVWQHNICMGVPEDEDEVGEHYFCEQCRPEEHDETVAAIKNGDKIWETRNKIYAQEKKMSRSRKSKSGKPGWLKRDLREESAVEEQKPTPTPAPDSKDTGNKRKRESEVSTKEGSEAPAEDKPTKGARQDKRRKSGITKSASEDPDTALVTIEKLPKDRQNIAVALSKIIAESITEQVKAGSYRVPDGQTSKSLGDRYASKIEYALQMHHEGPANKNYAAQFRMLHANLKQNKSLILELLSGAMTPDSMATMQSSDMASEKMQQERAAMKAEADRHATIDQKDAGPRYRRTHKGDELIEDESAATSSAPVARPVRHSVSDAEMAGMSPTREGAGSPSQPAQVPLTVDTKKSGPGHERRPSSQQFDVNSIWAKTAQSPTQQNAPRPMQVPPRRRSSVQHQQADGAKEDADVDRMLAEDDDDNYAPAEPSGADSIVWRGKLVQSSGDSEPTVNARFVAGRDVALTIPWKQMLPDKLNIDGRLQIQKAEEYLCGLQWSSSSDVSVLAFTPYDDAAAFQQFFDYFATRSRYAVVNKDKPSLVKDLYIIPIEPGGKLPDHVEMLEHCTLKRPIEERLLLATFVVARANDTPTPSTTQPLHTSEAAQGTPQQPTNGHHLPHHMRNSVAGPQGSPLQSSGPQFSPAPGPYGGPNSPLPPNPYQTSPQQPSANTPPTYPHQQQQQYPLPQQQQQQQQQPPAPQGFQPAPAYPPHSAIHNPLAAQILGDLQFTPSAQQILSADPQIGEEKLNNLKRILVEDEGARTDITILAAKLGAQGRV